MHSATRLLRAGVAALVLAVAGCGSNTDGRATDEVTVFAAASLADAFAELGDVFTSTRPDTTVTFNFAASSALATQIIEGAPADVFASADLHSMEILVDAGEHATEPVVFTTNRAQIIVEAGNPEGITGLGDLANGDLTVISCAPETPCGRYAQTVLDNAGVTVTFRSLEENVKAVVSKVTLGEADAGIVYATDVLAAGETATGVAIPADLNVVAEYPIAVTEASADSDAALAFIEFVLSSDGRAILESYGFVSP